MAANQETMREMILIRRLQVLINRACYTLADMSLTEYCLVCAVSEHPTGFSRRALQAELTTVESLDDYEDKLLKKELVQRIRSASDHRALALSLTAKGASLLEFMDTEIAMFLLERFPHATEESFQRVVELMAAFSAQMDPDAECTTMFPAAALKVLNAYRTIATTEASRLSLTFMHLCVFCRCGLGGGTASASAIARNLELPLQVFVHSLGSLEERGLIRLSEDDETILMTEAGESRLNALLGRVSARFSALIESHHAEGPYTELKQYLLYLVG